MTASDLVANIITRLSGTVFVSAASVQALAVSGPVATVAGQMLAYTVAAKDVYGNLATGYSGTVQWAGSDPNALWPISYTFVSTDAGVHVFDGVTMTTAGLQYVTVSDAAASSIHGTQGDVLVSPAAAQSLALTGATTTTAGGAYNFTVRAMDAYGNTATDYLGAVSFTSTDANAALPTGYVFARGDQGLSAHVANFVTAGAQSLTATDTATPSIVGAQTAIGVRPAAATHYSVAGLPSSLIAGQTTSITVTAQDDYSNTATDYVGVVHFTSSDVKAVLPSDTAFIASATFSGGVALATAGTQVLTATGTSFPELTGSQTAQVTPAGLSATVSTLTAAPIAIPADGSTRQRFGGIVKRYLWQRHCTAICDPRCCWPKYHVVTQQRRDRCQWPTHNLCIRHKLCGRHASVDRYHRREYVAHD